MGNPKQKWTSEEEEALRAGVAKHGPGKWKNIQRDPEFNHLLFSRSNIDLKDKWRNLSVANGQGHRDKSKAPKTKAIPAETPAIAPASTSATATPLLIAHTPVSVAPSIQDVSKDVVMVDASKPLPEGNNAAKYNTIIFEALSSLKELDSSAIAAYIEQRQEVPQNFKRALSSRLRRLVQQDKLEKFQNCYRIKGQAQVDTRIPLIKQNEVQPRQVPSIGFLGNTVQEAAVSAAYKIAEAENKSFVAAEAVREVERVSTIAEHMESLVQFAAYCFDQSGQGELVLMA